MSSEPPEDTRFKPGNKGGPGRSAHWLKPSDLRHHVGHMIRMTRAELEDVMNDPKSIMLELIVAQIIFKAAEYGDINRFEQLLNRTIGRVKENDININLTAVSDGELVKLAKEAIKVLERDKPLILEGHLDEQREDQSREESPGGRCPGDSESDEFQTPIALGPD